MKSQLLVKKNLNVRYELNVIYIKKGEIKKLQLQNIKFQI